jgi:ribonuclease-3
VLESLFEPQLEALAAIEGAPKSAKSRLQEWTQRHLRTKPVYQLTGTSGPPHEQHFRVSVTLDGQRLASGTGSSRQRAEEQAAAAALVQLEAGPAAAP